MPITNEQFWILAAVGMWGIMILYAVWPYLKDAFGGMWSQEETSWAKAERVTREEHEATMKKLRHYGARAGALLVVLAPMTAGAQQMTPYQMQQQLDRIESMQRQQRAYEFEQQMQAQRPPPVMQPPMPGSWGSAVSPADRALLLEMQRSQGR